MKNERDKMKPVGGSRPAIPRASRPGAVAPVEGDDEEEGAPEPRVSSFDSARADAMMRLSMSILSGPCASIFIVKSSDGEVEVAASSLADVTSKIVDGLVVRVGEDSSS